MSNAPLWTRFFLNSEKLRWMTNVRLPGLTLTRIITKTWSSSPMSRARVSLLKGDMSTCGKRGGQVDSASEDFLVLIILSSRRKRSAARPGFLMMYPSVRIRDSRWTAASRGTCNRTVCGESLYLNFRLDPNRF